MSDQEFSIVTPLLICTDVGLAKASIATPTGPWIDVARFAIGDGIGYADDIDGIRADTGLRGNLLFEGPITSYAFIEDNTIDLICKIPPDAGPWKFGEIAIFLEDGTMFAKAVFDDWQVKYSSLGTNLALTYTMHCLIRLDQSVAIFRVDTIDGLQSVLSIARWSDVIPPRLSPYPNIQLMIVRELDSNDNSTLLIQSTEANWTVATNFTKFAKLTVVDAADNWIEIPYEQWVGFYHPDSDVSQITFVLETSDGFFRSVAYIDYRIASGVVRFMLNPDVMLNIPVVGSRITAYHNVKGGESGGGLPLCSGTIENIELTRVSRIHTAFIPNLNPAWLVPGRVLAVNLDKSVLNEYETLVVRVNDVDYIVKAPSNSTILPHSLGSTAMSPLLMMQDDGSFLWLNIGENRPATEEEALAGLSKLYSITPFTLNAVIDNLRSSIPQGEAIGTMKYWPSATVMPPDGIWMVRNGSLLPINQYPELFAIIGNTYGGVAGSTFAIPNHSNGVFLRSTGGNAAALGIIQGDAIRNITGSFGGLDWHGGWANGAFAIFNNSEDLDGRGGTGKGASLDVSRMVPVANENRPISTSAVPIIKIK